MVEKARAQGNWQCVLCYSGCGDAASRTATIVPRRARPQLLLPALTHTDALLHPLLRSRAGAAPPHGPPPAATGLRLVRAVLACPRGADRFRAALQPRPEPPAPQLERRGTGAAGDPMAIDDDEPQELAGLAAAAAGAPGDAAAVASALPSDGAAAAGAWRAAATADPRVAQRLAEALLDCLALEPAHGAQGAAAGPERGVEGEGGGEQVGAWGVARPGEDGPLALPRAVLAALAALLEAGSFALLAALCGEPWLQVRGPAARGCTHAGSPRCEASGGCWAVRSEVQRRPRRRPAGVRPGQAPGALGRRRRRAAR